LGGLAGMLGQPRECAGRCGLGASKWSNGKPPVGLLFFVRGFWAQDGGMTGTLRERLIALIEPVVADLGCELVDLDLNPGLVRIFVDRAAGVRIEDCERVSREVSALLDVEDPIPTAYRLEVSSPGFDRVLRTSAHFERFVGARVWVELKVPRAGGRRRYTGRLAAVEDEGITLEVDDEAVSVQFGEIGKAKLAPQP
jgi:ribosome maturation factor RimP